MVKSVEVDVLIHSILSFGKLLSVSFRHLA